MARTALASHIEKLVANRAGLAVMAEEEGGVIRLSGLVGSDAAREAAEEVAAAAAPDRHIVNNLEVTSELPVGVAEFQEGGGETEQLEDVADIAATGGELEPDFTDLDAALAHEEGDEGAQVVFPPSDPVIGLDRGGQIEVIGGFSSDSMASIEVEASAEDTAPGDEAITEAVLRELREDAATTSLPIEVRVESGVVHLAGRVRGLEDVDAVEEVAERVPGVEYVIDEMEIPVT